MVGKLGMQNNGRVMKIFQRPSGSSVLSTPNSNINIFEKEKDKIINSWVNLIDNDSKISAQKILDKFEVSQYNMKETMPTV